MSSDAQQATQPLDRAIVRPGGRTARVRELVLAAVLEELGAVGYARLSLESVAERAGVNKTTLYRRWGSKSGLVATAVIRRQGELVPVPDTGTLRSDVLALLHEVRDSLSTPWLSALAAELGPRRATGDDVRAVLDSLWPERFRLSGQVFDRAVERGELPAGVDADLLLEALSGPLYFRWLLLGKPLTDQFLCEVTDLVLNGVRRGTPAAAAEPEGPKAARPKAARPASRTAT